MKYNTPCYFLILYGQFTFNLSPEALMHEQTRVVECTTGEKQPITAALF